MASKAETKAPKIFHCRLIPPRPDFAFTMTEEERELMGRHADYLRDRLAEGTMVWPLDLKKSRKDCRI